MEGQQIKKKVQEYGHKTWKEKMVNMSSMQKYRINKENIKEEQFYDNSLASILMFRCRSNTLRLGWRIEKEGGSARCVMCGEENADLFSRLRRGITLLLPGGDGRWRTGGEDASGLVDEDAGEPADEDAGSAGGCFVGTTAAGAAGRRWAKRKETPLIPLVYTFVPRLYFKIHAVFSKRRSAMLPLLRLDLGSDHLSPLIKLILLLSGQCPNPGPPYPCGVCGQNVTWHGISYLCTGCNRWVHRRCSGLNRVVDYNHQTWICSKCVENSTPAVLQPPSPPAPAPLTRFQQIRGHFLQFNTNGILNSHQQLTQLLKDQNILIACIQETKLTDTSSLPPFPNYAVLRKDRSQGRGGGLITLIHHSITYKEVYPNFFPGDTTIESQAYSIEVNGAELLICNIYIPPASSCPGGYTPDFNSIFNYSGDILIMGDFNAHDHSWYSSTLDERAAARGADIVNTLDGTALVVINEDTPTRMPADGLTSSPDLTITNSHLGINARWEPITTLNSDHLPIIIDLDGWFAEPPQCGPSCYTNFRQANWPRYQRESEELFRNLPDPRSCSTGEKVFREVLLRVSHRNIPRGKVNDFTPGLTQHIRELIWERDSIRVENSSDPRIHMLETQIQREIEQNKCEKWRSKVESCSINHCSGKYFKLLRDLSGKRNLQDPNQPIIFSGTTISDNRKIATKFVKSH